MSDEIPVPPEMLAWIDAEVAAGRFESRTALLAKALAFYKRELESARAFLAPALAEAAAGRGKPAEEVFAEIREMLGEKSSAE